MTMKLAIAPLLLSAVHGFTASSFANVRSNALTASLDPYAPLLDKLNGHVTSASTLSSSTIASSRVDMEQELLDALTSTLDAANNAMVASAEVSELRRIGVGEVQPLPFMLDAQAKLASIESQLHDIRTASPSNEVDFSALYASLNSALDTSIQAAEHAAHSSTEVIDKLVDFNLALSHSMGSFDLTPLTNVGDLLHSQLESVASGLATSDVPININDTGFQSFLGSLDRKLDNLSFDVSTEVAGLLVGYGMVAFLMGYAQNMGVDEYKMNLRRKMEVGEFDVEELASDIGYFKSKLASVRAGLTSVDYDAAIKLAYKASKSMDSFDTFRSEYLVKTSIMVAKKNPYVTATELKVPSQKVKKVAAQPRFTSVDYDAAAKLAYAKSSKTVQFEVFKSNYLVETSRMIANKNPYVRSQPAPPTHDITAESFMQQPIVKIAKKATKPKRVLPPASPLARLLAQELGLELTNIGKGSGRNGKILIEDVRAFHSKVEQAKDAIAKKQPYFATANA